MSKKQITIIMPKGFMNVEITTNNHLVADTNDGANWDTLKFPLPYGEWSIHSTEGKKVILNNNIRPAPVKCETDAVDFELWTQGGDCEWQLNDEDDWYKYPDTDTRITTEELYQIFKQNN